MGNPFDDVEASFHVLINDEGQHSLWPARIPVPDGWSAALSDAPHADCLTWIERSWTDMRPRSLAQATGAFAGESRGHAGA